MSVCINDWRLAFQGQLHRIDEHDFALIRAALAAVATQKGIGH
jgi:hypothetical protein